MTWLVSKQSKVLVKLRMVVLRLRTADIVRICVVVLDSLSGATNLATVGVAPAVSRPKICSAEHG